MPPKTADLRQAMRASAKSLPNRTRTEQVEAQPSSVVNIWPENPHYRPGRANKSNVTGYFPPAVKKQLRVMSAEQETTIQNLLAEALNYLFAKYGKPEIAPMEDSQ